MTERRTVYLDHSASTPTDPRVVETMMPFFTEIYGNPSSAHSFGRQAEAAVETARETVARLLNAQPSEIVFTSGGSEGDNLAIRGAAWAARKQGRGNRILTLPVEHSAVGKTIAQLADIMGFEQTVVPVNSYGIVDEDVFRRACVPGVVLASVMAANNEVGSVQPLRPLADMVHAGEAWLHTDAVQAAGQIPLDVRALDVDLLSLSAHKFYGPKGVGALYIRKGIDLIPSQSGGSHEDGRRAGTHNTAFIVGLAKALELSHDEMDEHVRHFQMMRDLLIDAVLARIPGTELTGHPTQRLPAHASFVIDGVESSTLVMHLDVRGIAASGGSACKTGNPEPSAVLLAMGLSPKKAMGSLRLSVGRQTTEADIDYVVDTLLDVVEKLRNLNSEWIR